MAKLTPAQDKAIQAFGADGEFPKGTRAATIDAIASAGLIKGDTSKGYKLTNDGWGYLGLVPIDVTTTTDEIQAELNTNPWDNVTEVESVQLPAGWDSARFANHNREVWKGLSQDEIRADILTARPVMNRASRRHPHKH